MLEGWLASLLRRVLHEWLEPASLNSLDVSLWTGYVRLADLRLKSSLLDGLGLPVRLVRGHIGQLTVKVHWGVRFGDRPTEITLDNVFLLLRTDLEYGDGPNGATAPAGSRTREHRDMLMHAAKMARVAAWEALSEARRSAHTKLVAGAPAGAHGMAALVDESLEAEAAVPGFVEKLVTAVLDGVVVSLRNLHVRWEDAVSMAPRVVAIGITLQSLTFASPPHVRKAVVESRQRKLAAIEAAARNAPAAAAAAAQRGIASTGGEEPVAAASAATVTPAASDAAGGEGGADALALAPGQATAAAVRPGGVRDAVASAVATGVGWGVGIVRSSLHWLTGAGGGNVDVAAGAGVNAGMDARAAATASGTEPAAEREDRQSAHNGSLVRSQGRSRGRSHARSNHRSTGRRTAGSARGQLHGSGDGSGIRTRWLPSWGAYHHINDDLFGDDLALMDDEDPMAWEAAAFDDEGSGGDGAAGAPWTASHSESAWDHGGLRRGRAGGHLRAYSDGSSRSSRSAGSSLRHATSDSSPAGGVCSSDSSRSSMKRRRRQSTRRRHGPGGADLMGAYGSNDAGSVVSADAAVPDGRLHDGRRGHTRHRPRRRQGSIDARAGDRAGAGGEADDADTASRDTLVCGASGSAGVAAAPRRRRPAGAGADATAGGTGEAAAPESRSVLSYLWPWSWAGGGGGEAAAAPEAAREAKGDRHGRPRRHGGGESQPADRGAGDGGAAPASDVLSPQVRSRLVRRCLYLNNLAVYLHVSDGAADGSGTRPPAATLVPPAASSAPQPARVRLFGSGGVPAPVVVASQGKASDTSGPIDLATCPAASFEAEMEGLVPKEHDLLTPPLTLTAAASELDHLSVGAAMRAASATPAVGTPPPTPRGPPVDWSGGPACMTLDSSRVSSPLFRLPSSLALAAHASRHTFIIAPTDAHLTLLINRNPRSTSAPQVAVRAVAGALHLQLLTVQYAAVVAMTAAWSAARLRHRYRQHRPLQRPLPAPPSALAGRPERGRAGSGSMTAASAGMAHSDDSDVLRRRLAAAWWRYAAYVVVREGGQRFGSTRAPAPPRPPTHAAPPAAPAATAAVTDAASVPSSSGEQSQRRPPMQPQIPEAHLAASAVGRLFAWRAMRRHGLLRRTYIQLLVRDALATAGALILPPSPWPAARQRVLHDYLARDEAEEATLLPSSPVAARRPFRVRGVAGSAAGPGGSRSGPAPRGRSERLARSRAPPADTPDRHHDRPSTRQQRQRQPGRRARTEGRDPRASGSSGDGDASDGGGGAAALRRRARDGARDPAHVAGVGAPPQRVAEAGEGGAGGGAGAGAGAGVAAIVKEARVLEALEWRELAALLPRLAAAVVDTADVDAGQPRGGSRGAPRAFNTAASGSRSDAAPTPDALGMPLAPWWLRWASRVKALAARISRLEAACEAARQAAAPRTSDGGTLGGAHSLFADGHITPMEPGGAVSSTEDRMGESAAPAAPSPSSMEASSDAAESTAASATAAPAAPAWASLHVDVGVVSVPLPVLPTQCQAGSSDFRASATPASPVRAGNAATAATVPIPGVAPPAGGEAAATASAAERVLERARTDMLTLLRLPRAWADDGAQSTAPDGGVVAVAARISSLQARYDPAALATTTTYTLPVARGAAAPGGGDSSGAGTAAQVALALRPLNHHEHIVLHELEMELPEDMLKLCRWSARQEVLRQLSALAVLRQRAERQAASGTQPLPSGGTQVSLSSMPGSISSASSGTALAATVAPPPAADAPSGAADVGIDLDDSFDMDAAVLGVQSRRLDAASPAEALPETTTTAPAPAQSAAPSLPLDLPQSSRLRLRRRQEGAGAAAGTASDSESTTSSASEAKPSAAVPRWGAGSKARMRGSVSGSAARGTAPVDAGSDTNSTRSSPALSSLVADSAEGLAAHAALVGGSGMPALSSWFDFTWLWNRPTGSADNLPETHQRGYAAADYGYSRGLGGPGTGGGAGGSPTGVRHATAASSSSGWAAGSSANPVVTSFAPMRVVLPPHLSKTAVRGGSRESSGAPAGPAAPASVVMHVARNAGSAVLGMLGGGAAASSAPSHVPLTYQGKTAAEVQWEARRRDFLSDVGFDGGPEPSLTLEAYPRTYAVTMLQLDFNNASITLSNLLSEPNQRQVHTFQLLAARVHATAASRVGSSKVDLTIGHASALQLHFLPRTVTVTRLLTSLAVGSVAPADVTSQVASSEHADLPPAASMRAAQSAAFDGTGDAGADRALGRPPMAAPGPASQAGRSHGHHSLGIGSTARSRRGGDGIRPPPLPTGSSAGDGASPAASPSLAAAAAAQPFLRFIVDTMPSESVRSAAGIRLGDAMRDSEGTSDVAAPAAAASHRGSTTVDATAMPSDRATPRSTGAASGTAGTGEASEREPSVAGSRTPSLLAAAAAAGPLWRVTSGRHGRSRAGRGKSLAPLRLASPAGEPRPSPLAAPTSGSAPSGGVAPLRVDVSRGPGMGAAAAATPASLAARGGAVTGRRAQSWATGADIVIIAILGPSAWFADANGLARAAQAVVDVREVAALRHAGTGHGSKTPAAGTRPTDELLERAQASVQRRLGVFSVGVLAEISAALQARRAVAVNLAARGLVVALPLAVRAPSAPLPTPIAGSGAAAGDRPTAAVVLRIGSVQVKSQRLQSRWQVSSALHTLVAGILASSIMPDPTITPTHEVLDSLYDRIRIMVGDAAGAVVLAAGGHSTGPLLSHLTIPNIDAPDTVPIHQPDREATWSRVIHVVEPLSLQALTHVSAAPGVPFLPRYSVAATIPRITIHARPILLRLMLPPAAPTSKPARTTAHNTAAPPSSAPRTTLSAIRLASAGRLSLSTLAGVGAGGAALRGAAPAQHETETDLSQFEDAMSDDPAGVGGPHSSAAALPAALQARHDNRIASPLARTRLTSLLSAVARDGEPALPATPTTLELPAAATSGSSMGAAASIRSPNIVDAGQVAASIDVESLVVLVHLHDEGGSLETPAAASTATHLPLPLHAPDVGGSVAGDGGGIAARLPHVAVSLTRLSATAGIASQSMRVEAHLQRATIDVQRDGDGIITRPHLSLSLEPAPPSSSSAPQASAGLHVALVRATVWGGGMGSALGLSPDAAATMQAVSGDSTVDAIDAAASLSPCGVGLLLPQRQSRMVISAGCVSATYDHAVARHLLALLSAPGSWRPQDPSLPPATPVAGAGGDDTGGGGAARGIALAAAADAAGAAAHGLSQPAPAPMRLLALESTSWLVSLARLQVLLQCSSESQPPSPAPSFTASSGAITCLHDTVSLGVVDVRLLAACGLLDGASRLADAAAAGSTASGTAAMPLASDGDADTLGGLGWRSHVARGSPFSLAPVPLALTTMQQIDGSDSSTSLRTSAPLDAPAHHYQSSGFSPAVAVAGGGAAGSAGTGSPAILAYTFSMPVLVRSRSTGRQSNAGASAARVAAALESASDAAGSLAGAAIPRRRIVRGAAAGGGTGSDSAVAVTPAVAASSWHSAAHESGGASVFATPLHRSTYSGETAASASSMVLTSGLWARSAAAAHARGSGSEVAAMSDLELTLAAVASAASGSEASARRLSGSVRRAPHSRYRTANGRLTAELGGAASVGVGGLVADGSDEASAAFDGPAPAEEAAVVVVQASAVLPLLETMQTRRLCLRASHLAADVAHDQQQQGAAAPAAVPVATMPAAMAVDPVVVVPPQPLMSLQGDVIVRLMQLPAVDGDAMLEGGPAAWLSGADVTAQPGDAAAASTLASTCDAAVQRCPVAVLASLLAPSQPRQLLVVASHIRGLRAAPRIASVQGAIALVAALRGDVIADGARRQTPVGQQPSPAAADLPSSTVLPRQLLADIALRDVELRLPLATAGVAGDAAELRVTIATARANKRGCREQALSMAVQGLEVGVATAATSGGASMQLLVAMPDEASLILQEAEDDGSSDAAPTLRADSRVGEVAVAVPIDAVPMLRLTAAAWSQALKVTRDGDELADEEPARDIPVMARAVHASASLAALRLAIIGAAPSTGGGSVTPDGPRASLELRGVSVGARRPARGGEVLTQVAVHAWRLGVTPAQALRERGSAALPEAEHCLVDAISGGTPEIGPAPPRARAGPSDGSSESAVATEGAATGLLSRALARVVADVTAATPPLLPSTLMHHTPALSLTWTRAAPARSARQHRASATVLRPTSGGGAAHRTARRRHSQLPVPPAAGLGLEPIEEVAEEWDAATDAAIAPLPASLRLHIAATAVSLQPGSLAALAALVSQRHMLRSPALPVSDAYTPGAGVSSASAAVAADVPLHLDIAWDSPQLRVRWPCDPSGEDVGHACHVDYRLVLHCRHLQLRRQAADSTLRDRTPQLAVRGSALAASLETLLGDGLVAVASHPLLSSVDVALTRQTAPAAAVAAAPSTEHAERAPPTLHSTAGAAPASWQEPTTDVPSPRGASADTVTVNVAPLALHVAPYDVRALSALQRATASLWLHDDDARGAHTTIAPPSPPAAVAAAPMPTQAHVVVTLASLQLRLLASPVPRAHLPPAAGACRSVRSSFTIALEDVAVAVRQRGDMQSATSSAASLRVTHFSGSRSHSIVTTQAGAAVSRCIMMHVLRSTVSRGSPRALDATFHADGRLTVSLPHAAVMQDAMTWWKGTLSSASNAAAYVLWNCCGIAIAASCAPGDDPDAAPSTAAPSAIGCVVDAGEQSVWALPWPATSAAAAGATAPVCQPLLTQLVSPCHPRVVVAHTASFVFNALPCDITMACDGATDVAAGDAAVTALRPWVGRFVPADWAAAHAGGVMAPVLEGDAHASARLLLGIGAGGTAAPAAALPQIEHSALRRGHGQAHLLAQSRAAAVVAVSGPLASRLLTHVLCARSKRLPLSFSGSPEGDMGQRVIDPAAYVWPSPGHPAAAASVAGATVTAMAVLPRLLLINALHGHLTIDTAAGSLQLPAGHAAAADATWLTTPDSSTSAWRFRVPHASLRSPASIDMAARIGSAPLPAALPPSSTWLLRRAHQHAVARGWPSELLDFDASRLLELLLVDASSRLTVMTAAAIPTLLGTHILVIDAALQLIDASGLGLRAYHAVQRHLAGIAAADFEGRTWWQAALHHLFDEGGILERLAATAAIASSGVTASAASTPVPPATLGSRHSGEAGVVSDGAAGAWWAALRVGFARRATAASMRYGRWDTPAPGAAPLPVRPPILDGTASHDVAAPSTAATPRPRDGDGDTVASDDGGESTGTPLASMGSYGAERTPHALRVSALRRVSVASTDTDAVVRASSLPPAAAAALARSAVRPFAGRHNRAGGIAGAPHHRAALATPPTPYTSTPPATPLRPPLLALRTASTGSAHGSGSHPTRQPSQPPSAAAWPVALFSLLPHTADVPWSGAEAEMRSHEGDWLQGWRGAVAAADAADDGSALAGAAPTPLDDAVVRFAMPLGASAAAAAVAGSHSSVIADATVALAVPSGRRGIPPLQRDIPLLAGASSVAQLLDGVVAPTARIWRPRYALAVAALPFRASGGAQDGTLSSDELLLDVEAGTPRGRGGAGSDHASIASGGTAAAAARLSEPSSAARTVRVQAAVAVGGGGSSACIARPAITIANADTEAVLVVIVASAAAALLAPLPHSAVSVVAGVPLAPCSPGGREVPAAPPRWLVASSRTAVGHLIAGAADVGCGEQPGLDSVAGEGAPLPLVLSLLGTVAADGRQWRGLANETAGLCHIALVPPGGAAPLHPGFLGASPTGESGRLAATPAIMAALQGLGISHAALGPGDARVAFALLPVAAVPGFTVSCGLGHAREVEAAVSGEGPRGLVLLEGLPLHVAYAALRSAGMGSAGDAGGVTPALPIAPLLHHASTAGKGGQAGISLPLLAPDETLATLTTGALLLTASASTDGASAAGLRLALQRYRWEESRPSPPSGSVLLHNRATGPLAVEVHCAGDVALAAFRTTKLLAPAVPPGTTLQLHGCDLLGVTSVHAAAPSSTAAAAVALPAVLRFNLPCYNTAAAATAAGSGEVLAPSHLVGYGWVGVGGTQHLTVAPDTPATTASIAVTQPASEVRWAARIAEVAIAAAAPADAGRQQPWPSGSDEGGTSTSSTRMQVARLEVAGHTPAGSAAEATMSVGFDALVWQEQRLRGRQQRLAALLTPAAPATDLEEWVARCRLGMPMEAVPPLRLAVGPVACRTEMRWRDAAARAESAVVRRASLRLAWPKWTMAVSAVTSSSAALAAMARLAVMGGDPRETAAAPPPRPVLEAAAMIMESVVAEAADGTLVLGDGADRQVVPLITPTLHTAGAFATAAQRAWWMQLLSSIRVSSMRELLGTYLPTRAVPAALAWLMGRLQAEGSMVAGAAASILPESVEAVMRLRGAAEGPPMWAAGEAAGSWALALVRAVEAGASDGRLIAHVLRLAGSGGGGGGSMRVVQSIPLWHVTSVRIESTAPSLAGLGGGGSMAGESVVVHLTFAEPDGEAPAASSPALLRMRRVAMAFDTAATAEPLLRALPRRAWRQQHVAVARGSDAAAGHGGPASAGAI